jgi:hypothetical protein
MVIKICNYPLEYFIYIIIFILVLTIIFSLLSNNVIERFNGDNKNIAIELDEYKKELEMSKIKEDKLKIEIELIKNYTKINDTDFNNIKSYALETFFDNGNITIPSLKDNAMIIDSNDNLNLLISKTLNLKNIYKVGEKVLHDSTFYITNNDICYSNIPSSETGLYNGCVVCSINPSNNYMATKNKTNIESVCLYNDNKINNTIPTSSLCESVCIGRTN